MISFELFSPAGSAPIYQQIIMYVKRGIASGVIRDGDEMPSRRMLSALLGVNPNTAQKACRILEDEGLISSSPGAKSFVTASREKIAAVRREVFESQISELIAIMKQTGMTLDTCIETVTRLWDENNGRKDESL